MKTALIAFSLSLFGVAFYTTVKALDAAIAVLESLK